MEHEISIPEELTYEDIRVQYGTGRYVRILAPAGTRRASTAPVS